ncbi:hypothetical protein ABZT17_12345 [Streptomyces sp. NPDC005648]|uniref:hypothetical protein n=1 Tax=Streptomyces sp. NPDC005648 TaxID=3157044 RepID=UPI0033AEA3F9
MSVASADEGCPRDFSGLLNCWAGRFGQGPLTFTVEGALPYEGGQRQDTVKKVQIRHQDLSVQVPSGRHTGEGGTVLLVLADHRFVAPDAEVDLLSRKTVDELKNLHVCGFGPKGENLCDALAVDREKPPSPLLTGKQMIDAGYAAPLGGHAFTVAPSPTHTTDGPKTPSPTDTTNASDDSGQGASGPLWASVGALAAFVVAGALYAVYRTRGEGPHPRHALAVAVAGGPGTTPAPTPAPGPAPPARPRPVEPRRVHGRSVGPRRNPSARAVVRTELHPQGYIEIDGVLHRAVWAEPDRPPPAPGGQVDFTRPHEADSDVLYAFSCEGSPHPHH